MQGDVTAAKLPQDILLTSLKGVKEELPPAVADCITQSSRSPKQRRVIVVALLLRPRPTFTSSDTTLIFLKNDECFDFTWGKSN